MSNDIEDTCVDQSVAKKLLKYNEVILSADEYNRKPRSINSDEDISQIQELLEKLLATNVQTVNDMKNFLLENGRRMKKMVSKQELLYVYRNGYTKHNPDILELLQTKPQRSISGVMVYAVLTPPLWENGGTFSCKYDCIYCPKEPDMPRSYISTEPGVMRAHKLNFDTVAQMYERYNQYRACGHPNDKAEVIVLGGTWHSYSLEIRQRFIRDLFYGANTMHKNRTRERLTMSEEIKLNEEADCRIIGITIETRPDQINGPELVELRNMGVTRVQLGVQHINDEILNRINRQCSNKHTINAIKMLKDSGFKVDIHLMPDLPKPYNSNMDVLEEDYNMFKTVIEDACYQVDQMKIYPCTVVPWTKLKEEFDQGVYVPYGAINGEETEEMIELLIWLKSHIPEWVRLNRIIRDIPEEYITGGVQNMNMRQSLQEKMKTRNLECRCIRCREIKNSKIDYTNIQLKVDEYQSSDGTEYFIQYETTDRKNILGFVRLRLTSSSGKCGNKIVFPELVDAALIRELHIYGKTTEVNRSANKTKSNVQHNGLGSRLVQKAIEISKENSYNKIAVISGEGVKPYYRTLGFTDEKHYLVKDI